MRVVQNSLHCVYSRSRAYMYTRLGFPKLPTGLGRCSDYEFECPSGDCINGTNRCDGVSNCPGSEDEIFLSSVLFL